MKVPVSFELEFDEEGKITAAGRTVLDSFLTELNYAFGPRGIRVPKLKETEINKIQDMEGINGSAILLYDTTNDKLVVNINGIFREIQII